MSLNSQLSKPLQVSVGNDAGFAVISAHLTRTTATTEVSYLAVRVRNIGTAGACFLKADSIVYFGAGAEILDGGPAYIEGSNSSVTASINTSTCLMPGEDGYLLDIKLALDGGLYSKVDGIRFGWSFSQPGAVPASRLIPESYDAGSPVRILVRNTGTKGATIQSLLARSMPFDSSTGLPMVWGFASAPGISNVTVDAGATIGVQAFHNNDGTADRLYVNVGDFGDCATCVRPQSFDLETDEGVLQLHEAWNEAETRKFERLNGR